MSNPESVFAEDVKRIQSLDIVPSILEIICRTTGMGFSAVARVTDTRWIACAVKDEINFGLKPGGELQLETTICNEIRGHGQAVVIDEVRCDDQFRDHHTPAMYGFQSYISIPIILKDGSFFGTLCAIDPKPFALRSSNMVSMFNLFADLISYHLLTQDQLRETARVLKNTENKLKVSLADNLQYSFISHHTLREPLRKLQLYTDMLERDRSLPDDHKTKKLAAKINKLSRDFSIMIGQLTDFSAIGSTEENHVQVDLDEVIRIVRQRLLLKIMKKKARIESTNLPEIPAIPSQIAQLFYCMLDNALNFSRPGVTPVINIFTETCSADDLLHPEMIPGVAYCKICISDNGIGIDSSHLTEIFRLFSKLNPQNEPEGMGMGLSISKRIIDNHKGAILVKSQPGVGTQFSFILPTVELKAENDSVQKETVAKTEM